MEHSQIHRSALVAPVYESTWFYRFHVGFAERGLKNWAKKPATTSQKGGVFEGQCAARM
jgi:hypothetical protein